MTRPRPLCTHKHIFLQPSLFAFTTTYKQPPAEQRAKATTSSNKPPPCPEASSFPAPLILPGDDLALEDQSVQSLRSWVREPDRNKVTPSRNVVYVANVPESTDDLDFISDWTVPKLCTTDAHIGVDIHAVVDYVSAFYHGLEVKLLPSSTFRYFAWECDIQNRTIKRRALTQLKTGTSKKAPQIIGIEAAGQQNIGVRVRQSPDSVFPRQLNLNDLIDAVIEALPSDAYAMVLLTNHDLYEDDDDEFVCGRAYGGSRVAVISTARYNPALDQLVGLNTVHAWPNSHCAGYISSLIQGESQVDIDVDTATTNPTRLDPSTPIGAAIQAVGTYRAELQETESNAWLGRVCRTVSHELGHCFGIDHCVYYACCMQGSANLHEDLRQPPYLCPVDLAKVLKATGSSVDAHCRAMIECCERYGGVELFVAYAAWLKRRVELMHR